MALFATIDDASSALMSHAGLSRAEADTFTKRARPAITFRRRITDESDVPLGTSKVGGRPDMGADIPWPIRAPYPGINAVIDAYPEILQTIHSPEWFAAHRAYLSAPAPLAFIAQIDLDAMAPRAGFDTDLPNTGRLLLFTDPSGYGGGATAISRPWLQVIHDTTPPAELIRHPTPDALRRHWETSPLVRAYEDREISWSEAMQAEVLEPINAISLPHDTAYQAPERTMRILNALHEGHLRGLENDAFSISYPDGGYHGDQLGGHPKPVQDNVTRDFQRASEGALDPVTLPERNGTFGPERWRHLMTVQGETYLPQLMTDWRDGDLYVMDRPLLQQPGTLGQTWGLSQAT